ncbi:mucin-5AC-like [Procambarus clarkii]|uniref:mucin-5AC-like n=1 Tax=Procambarus clarkii TaxID=6728 RepID=UPI0037439D80
MSGPRRGDRGPDGVDTSQHVNTSFPLTPGISLTPGLVARHPPAPQRGSAEDLEVVLRPLVGAGAQELQLTPYGHRNPLFYYTRRGLASRSNGSDAVEVGSGGVGLNLRPGSSQNDTFENSQVLSLVGNVVSEVLQEVLPGFGYSLGTLLSNSSAVRSTSVHPEGESLHSGPMDEVREQSIYDLASKTAQVKKVGETSYGDSFIISLLPQTVRETLFMRGEEDLATSVTTHVNHPTRSQEYYWFRRANTNTTNSHSSNLSDPSETINGKTDNSGTQSEIEYITESMRNGSGLKPLEAANFSYALTQNRERLNARLSDNVAEPQMKPVSSKEASRVPLEGTSLIPSAALKNVTEAGKDEQTSSGGLSSPLSILPLFSTYLSYLSEFYSSPFSPISSTLFYGSDFPPPAGDHLLKAVKKTTTVRHVPDSHPSDTFIISLVSELPGTTSEPPRTRSEPPRTRSEPLRTRSEPPRTTSEPPRTASEPSRTASEPSRTRSEPSRTRSEPSRTTSEPSRTRSEPPRTTSEPPRTTSEPSRTTSEPPRTTSEPPRTTSEPSRTTSEPPRTTSEPPRTTSESPRPTLEPPRTTSEPPRPTSEPPRTTSESPRPTSEPPRTTSESPRPTSEPPRTTSESPRPTSEPPRTTSEPPRTTSEPPRPTSEPPRTTSESPRPTSEPPRTTSESPRPTSEPPRTTSEPPRPTSELPRTTSEPPRTTSEPPRTTSEPSTTTPKHVAKSTILSAATDADEVDMFPNPSADKQDLINGRGLRDESIEAGSSKERVRRSVSGAPAGERAGGARDLITWYPEALEPSHTSRVVQRRKPLRPTRIDRDELVVKRPPARLPPAATITSKPYYVLPIWAGDQVSAGFREEPSKNGIKDMISKGSIFRNSGVVTNKGGLVEKYPARYPEVNFGEDPGLYPGVYSGGNPARDDSGLKSTRTEGFSRGDSTQTPEEYPGGDTNSLVTWFPYLDEVYLGTERDDHTRLVTWSAVYDK